MNKRLFFRLVLTLLGLAYLEPGLATGDAEELIRKSDAQLKSKTEQISYRMEIIAKDGRVEQVRKFITYSKHGPKEERTLQKFENPPVYEGTGLLIVDHNSAQNDIWLYLPSSRRIRRIAGQEKSNRYMGTEYSYEDFEDYQISEYDFRLLQAGPCKETQGQCQVVEAIPKTQAEKDASGYAKKIYWLEKESLYPVRIELYGAQNELLKVEHADGLHRVSGYWRPDSQVMLNKHSGRSTRLEIIEDKIDQSLDDFYVSKRFLRQ
jgi:outer membrane lipoprotein-sorting protein